MRLTDRTPSFVERVTRVIVFASAIFALAGDAWMASLVVPSMRWSVPLIFATAWVVGRARPTIATASTFFACYLVPAAFILARSDFFLAGWSIWFAALLGTIAATSPLGRWSLPVSWRLPLVYWALVVAGTWPIVMLREDGFTWPPGNPTLIAWVTTTASIVLCGILWFDAAFAQATEDGQGQWRTIIERRAVFPMAAGWLIGATVGVYQLAGHIAFLNPGFWSVIGRATGTLDEANVFGVVSAMWGPLVFVLAIDRGGWRLNAAGVGALLLSWAVVWGSGSRSSLLIVALSLVVIVYHVWRRYGPRRTGRALLVVIPVAMAAVILVVRATAVSGPLSRFAIDFQPHWSWEWLRGFAKLLWTRGGFGDVADAMLRRFPLIGIGVGAYHYAYESFAIMLFSGLPASADNAQNWYRHELVELGIVGSLGWIVWTLTFGWRVARGIVAANASVVRPAIAVVLAGFGLISLVGVPGQETAVVMTMWTLAAWYVSLGRPGSPDGARSRAFPAGAWAVALMVVAGHAVATAYYGKTMLTPLRRAVLTNTDYFLGLYEPETTPDGVTFRWTKQNAIAAIRTPNPPNPWLRVTVWVNHADVAQHPVDMKVWNDDRLIMQLHLTTNEPHTVYLRVPDGHSRTIVKTWVSRTVRPSDFGAADTRELGLQIAWSSITEAPPSGAIVINGR